MEAREEAMASYSTSTSSSTSLDDPPPPPTFKRSRTRRHRPTSSASAATPSSSASEAGFTDEEDMANCLILLAQGGGGGGGVSRGGGTVSAAKKFTSKRFAEAAATAAGRAGFYVYECKTCNKCFPSFQALGGHRASHKKLKMAAEAAVSGEKKAVGDENSHLLPSPNSRKGKVHECSICQSEFSSGQALGGHMRRHRPAADLPEDLKKEKTVLALDLNLPAPAEDDTSFPIPGKPLVFSPAATLVDCLY